MDPPPLVSSNQSLRPNLKVTSSRKPGTSSGHSQPPIQPPSPQVVIARLGVLSSCPQAKAEKEAGPRPDEDIRLRDIEPPDWAHTAPVAHLGEATLVIEDAQDAIGLQGDEVDAGLIVGKADLPPVDLFPDVLLLPVSGAQPPALPAPHPPLLPGWIHLKGPGQEAHSLGRQHEASLSPVPPSAWASPVKDPPRGLLSAQLPASSPSRAQAFTCAGPGLERLSLHSDWPPRVCPSRASRGCPAPGRPAGRREGAGVRREALHTCSSWNTILLKRYWRFSFA